MRAALVVAHPDDESLWGAGIVLNNKAWWTVICCSIPRIDPVRAYKFFGACDVLRATGRLLPVVESSPDQPLRGLEMLDLNEFDWIVTHGRGPEPGYPIHHPHHKQVHEHVVKHYSHLRLWGFGQGQAYALSPSQLEIKRAALRCYDHALPYEGRTIPKWQALMHRYCEVGGYDLGVERYDSLSH